MASSFLTQFLVGVGLSLIQCVAAAPWVLLLVRVSSRAWWRRSDVWLSALGAVVGLGLVMALLLQTVRDIDNLQFLGKIYASLLQAQLTADLLIALFAMIMMAWPKGGTVGLAAFLEGIRQPMFLLLLGAGVILMVVLPFIPYFTFGEDHLMTKDLGLELIMLASLAFGVLLASLSISEEIEGRTAVTLMSKPVSRRQFLLGKYLGILLACLLLTGVLGWCYGWMTGFKSWYDRVGWYDDDASRRTVFPSAVDAWLQAGIPGDEGRALLRGSIIWGLDVSEGLPGLVLGFSHVMVLLAATVCLATRLHFAANIVTCAVLFVLGHLSPILVQSAEYRNQPAHGGGTAVTQLLEFMARLFNRILPDLQLFSPTRINDAPIATSQLAFYAGEVCGYSILYTAILLLFGLVLFEDRDLA